MDRDLYQEVTDTILERLEKGVVPWVRPWSIGGCHSVPRNGASGRAYHGMNVLLLWIAGDAKGYPTSDWMTYRQAAALGGQVRKGERGTTVTLWKPLDVADTSEGALPGARKKILLLRGYTVFNRAQIDGLPALPAEAPLPAIERDAKVEDVVRKTGAEIREGEREGRAFYSPDGDYIGMPAIGRFKDRGAYYSTLLHEITHWTGAASRLKRDLSGRFGGEAYAAEELVAEMGSAFLCADLGVDGTLQHPEYVGHWIKVMKGDKRAIFTAASKAREAAAFVLGTGAEAETASAEA